MLDWLARDEGMESAEAFKEAAGIDVFAYPEEPNPFNVHADNLQRLRLIVVNRPDRAVEVLARKIDKRPSLRGGTWVSITALGKALVEACTPPVAAPTESA